MTLARFALGHAGRQHAHGRAGSRRPRGGAGRPAADVVAGAGFGVDDVAVEDLSIRMRVRRQRTLPDTVGPGMRLLVCGLNPSVLRGRRRRRLPRPGNRFWPAARRGGNRRTRPGPCRRARSPRHRDDRSRQARHHGRECPRAAEYRDGSARVERIVRWLCPAAVCFVGLAGWRAAVDPARQPANRRPASVVCPPT